MQLTGRPFAVSFQIVFPLQKWEIAGEAVAAHVFVHVTCVTKIDIGQEPHPARSTIGQFEVFVDRAIGPESPARFEQSRRAVNLSLAATGNRREVVLGNNVTVERTMPQILSKISA